MDHAWTCGCCGKQFNTLPLDFSPEAPDYWLQIPEAEREQRGKIDEDVCIIKHSDGRDIFLRGVIEIPIIGIDECFRWGAWVSLSEESFGRVLDLWTAEVIENEPPKFGWLSNKISIYPNTLNLKTHVHLRPGKLRPAIELEPTDHPLAIEQRDGITMDRVEEIVAACSNGH
jgi:hypothetical protein